MSTPAVVAPDSTSVIDPEGDAQAVTLARAHTNEVLQRLRHSIGKCAPQLSQNAVRDLIAQEADKVYAKKLPKWYRRTSHDTATIDLRAFGYGCATIGDAPMNVAATYAEMMVKSKLSPKSTELRAAGMNAYLRAFDGGPKESVLLQKVPPPGQGPSHWLGWIGQFTDRVIGRIEDGINIFLSEDDVEGESSPAGSPT